MRILGIDPGVAIVGFGVLDCAGARQQMVQYGAINTPAGMPLAARLTLIESDLTALIREFHPDEMAIEELFFSKNITTGIAVAHGRGVLLCAAERCGIPLFEYTPGQVKMAVTGYGKAVKKQVQEMTRILLHLPAIPKPDDTADALAMAITFCHTNGSQLNRFVRRVPGPI